MNNQSGTIKTNLELYRVVMGGSGGYRRLTVGSDDFLLQTYRQTDTSPLYIYHPHCDHHVDHVGRWVTRWTATQSASSCQAATTTWCFVSRRTSILSRYIVWRCRKQCWFLMIIDQPALYPSIYNGIDLAILFLFFCFCDNISKPRWAVFVWQQGPSPICTSLASSRSSSKSTLSSSSPSSSTTGLHGDHCGCRCSWPFLLLLYLTHPLQGL